ncbi:MAG: YeaH/YhbH family protein [Pseudomonadales bacterium]
MAFLIIDRRLNGKHKSAVNRQRFLRRYRKHIREAVADSIKKRSITDMERGESVSIPRKDVSEPSFHHDKGGRQTRIFPGNKEFKTGDHIQRPQGGEAGGSGPGDPADAGEGADEFVFELTQEEFMEFMFEGLELPNLVKKQIVNTTSFSRVKGGYTNEGIPARLNVLQSLRSAYARRIALGGRARKQVKALEAELKTLEKQAANDRDAGLEAHSQLRISEIKAELERLNKRLKKIPYLDDFDLKYNNVIDVPRPSTSAVMFCLMDVSGSMTQDIKDIAKRFFILLYMFLKRNYQKIDVVFIRHHTTASEVDEETFFYSRETGGTLVSSALRLMDEIIRERYPEDSWNIYAAQASDGDNWADDSPACRKLLVDKILPKLQYYTYVEITPRDHQALWYAYENVVDRYPDTFAMQQIESLDDIYPVFHKLFERKSS